MAYEADQWSFDPSNDPDGAARAERAIAWLEDKWGADRECPYCRGTEWGVTGTFHLIRNTAAGMKAGSETSFQAVCRGCGNTVFLGTGITKLDG